MPRGTRNILWHGFDRTIEATGQYADWNSAEEKELVMRRLREARRIFEDMK